MSIDVSGKKVVVTGTFSEQRSQLESKLSELGAEVNSGVSSKTNILFAGEKAGSKLAKAQELGIPVYGEAELMELLGGSQAAPAKTEKAEKVTKTAKKVAAKPAKPEATAAEPSRPIPFSNPAKSELTYPAFPTPMPLRGAWRGMDLGYGVFAIAYEEPKIYVVDSRHDFKETSFELPAKQGWAVASVRCIKVVLYEDAPCLVIGYSLKAAGASKSEGAAIGLFRCDGSPIVVHEAQGDDGVDVLAVTPDGKFLVWRAGGRPLAACVTDFVTGQKWQPLEASPYADLVFDNNGVLYEYGVGCSVHEPSSKPTELLWNGIVRLFGVGDGLLGPHFRLKDGELSTMDSSTWAQAVKGEDGDDEFTAYRAVGDGQMACFGPGSTETPHLCFVDLSTNSVLLVHPLPRESFQLFLEDDTLYIVDKSQMVSMPWPSVEKLRAEHGAVKQEPVLPLVGVRKTLPVGDARFPARIRLREEVINVDINHGVIAYPTGDEFYVIEPGQDARKIELAWQSEFFLDRARPAEINGVKVVLHEGRPCLAISSNNDGPPKSDGPAIGIYELNGSCLAIRYDFKEKARKAKKEGAYRYSHMKLIAASLEGDKIAWTEGYTLRIQTVSDFIAGREPETWDEEGLASSVYSAAFALSGELYIRNVHGVSQLNSVTKTQKLRTKADSIHAVDQGVFAEKSLITEAKTYRFDTLAWLAAVGDENGGLTIDSAVGADDILCVGPISRKNPHLCFIRASTGEVLSVEKRPNKQLFDLFLVNGSLHVVDARAIVTTPWPGAEPAASAAPKKVKPSKVDPVISEVADPVLADFNAFKAKLKKAKSPLLKGLEAIEAQFKEGKKLWRFEAPEPKSLAERKALLTAVEARHKGVFLPELRTSILNLYGISDGFSFVLAPESMPDPSGTDEERQEWDDAIVGYQLYSIERFTSPENAQLFRSQDYQEPIEELFASDLKGGAKPDSAKFLYASYLSLDMSEAEVTFNGNSTFYSQSNVVHGVSLRTATFPGGILSPDGDDQWSLNLDEDGELANLSFAELVANEIEEALEDFA
jgi:hypothetical protein